MKEVQCVRIRLNPESLALVREWAETLNKTRRIEAVATMIEEGVTIESYFVDHCSDGDYLIGYMRADSLEEAANVSSTSEHDIDRYHQQVKRTAWVEVTHLEPLVDLLALRG